MAAAFLLFGILMITSFLYWMLGKMRCIAVGNAQGGECDVLIELRLPLNLILFKATLMLRRQKDGLTLFLVRGKKKRRLGTIAELIHKKRSKRPFLWKAFRESRLVQLHADLKAGTGDAALTAVVIGLIQASAASAASICDNKDVRVRCTPVYSGPFFKLSVTCILELKKANIIFDLVKLIIKV